jgi:hypothetical protein
MNISVLWINFGIFRVLQIFYNIIIILCLYIAKTVFGLLTFKKLIFIEFRLFIYINMFKYSSRI